MPEPDYFLRYDFSAATLKFTSEKCDVHGLSAAAARSAFNWFYSLSRRNTFVGGKCALPSALLVSTCIALVIFPHWSLIDMHHLAFGISFQIHFVSRISHVSIHLLHLSTHLCHHCHSHHSSLLHFFTSGSKPTFSTNPSHLNFTALPTGLPSWSFIHF